MYENLTHGFRILLDFPAVSIIGKDYVVLKKETVKEKRIKYVAFSKSSKTS